MHWERRVIPTGPPEKSLEAILMADIFLGICPFHLFSNVLAKDQVIVISCFAESGFVSFSSVLPL